MRLDALGRYLRSTSGDTIVLAFAQIESIIGGPLPASAQYPAFWSNTSYYARSWTEAGFRTTSRNVPTGHRAFVRDRAANPAAAPPTATAPPIAAEVRDSLGAGLPATNRVVLIGCVKTKGLSPAPAGELFTSPLFLRRRAYAEASGRPWFVLSAKYGLLSPSEPVAPYDVYLADQTPSYQQVWGLWVVEQLQRALGQLRGHTFEVHAGRSYVDPLRAPLAAVGAEIAAPLEHLRQGEQLAWYTSEIDVGHEAAAGLLAAVPAFAPAHFTPAATGAPRQGVVAGLLAYGASLARGAETPAGPPSFTPLPAANDLLLADPFAFLVAVIFDQGIPAERAWRAPYDLLRRLGYLDPERVAADDHAVRAAINQPPKLHRFVDRLPEWVSAAARRVVTDYGGDAGRIWGDRPTAIQLMQRLEQFQGIGQKKAAMAVEILERDLHVEVTDMRGSDIAYDVHVRRVFLRTGLAQYDDLDHMLDVARSAHPERPGAIDYPAWLVGRQWCRAGVPDCPNCVLSDVCPKLITAASTVRGA